MAGGNRRKCRCCLKLFRPDPRNRRHQRYCSAPACRAASKAASQARWLTRPENHGYFPGYWRRGRGISPALQDLSMAQPFDPPDKTADSIGLPLQEVVVAQPAVLIGLIAHIVGTPLQDDIARTTDRLLRLGQDILATSTERGDNAPRA